MKKLIALALIITSINAFGQDKNISKSFEGIKKIELNISSGDVELSKSSSSTVSVDLTYTFDESIYTPSMEKRGETLVIKEKFGNGGGSGSSRWNLEVPDGLEVGINTSSGDLKVDDLEMDLRLNASSGDTELNNLTGKTRINTSSGDIDIMNHSGDITINLSSGDVELEEANGKISVNSSSGEVNIRSSSGDFGINSSSGDITARGISIIGSSSFNASSGDIEITLTTELDHDISLQSSSGNAVLDFNGTDVNGLVEMKVRKNKGEISAPFKFDKEEEEGSGRDTYIIKTAKIGNKDIDIKIGSASGKAQIKE